MRIKELSKIIVENLKLVVALENLEELTKKKTNKQKKLLKGPFSSLYIL